MYNQSTIDIQSSKNKHFMSIYAIYLSIIKSCTYWDCSTLQALHEHACLFYEECDVHSVSKMPSVITVTCIGNNNFHSESNSQWFNYLPPNVQLNCTCQVYYRAYTLLHNVSLLHILYYESIFVHSLLAITVLAFVWASHSNTTIIHFSMRTLAHAITRYQLHFSSSNKRDAFSHQGSF